MQLDSVVDQSGYRPGLKLDGRHGKEMLSAIRWLM